MSPFTSPYLTKKPLKMKLWTKTSFTHLVFSFSGKNISWAPDCPIWLCKEWRHFTLCTSVHFYLRHFCWAVWYLNISSHSIFSSTGQKYSLLEWMWQLSVSMYKKDRSRSKLHNLKNNTGVDVTVLCSRLFLSHSNI